MKLTFKKALVLLTVISVFAVMLVMSASAATETGSYAAGNIEWSYDTESGIMTVTPTAATIDFGSTTSSNSKTALGSNSN